MVQEAGEEKEVRGTSHPEVRVLVTRIITQVIILQSHLTSMASGEPYFKHFNHSGQCPNESRNSAI